MENYIVINGKKAELTEEQLVALGIEIKKNDPSIYFDIHFYTEEIARNAIEEIIKPFIKEHPDFYLFKNI